MDTVNEAERDHGDQKDYPTGQCPSSKAPITSPVPPRPHGLCERCAAIDLDQIFQRDVHRSSFVLNLGSIADLEASDCDLCRFFASLAPRNSPPNPRLHEHAVSVFSSGNYHLRVFNASWVFTGHRRRRAEEQIARSNDCSAKTHLNVLGVTPSASSPTQEDYQHIWLPREIFRETGYISLSSPSSSPSLCNIRAVHPKFFDVSLAGQWLAYCEARHGDHCSHRPDKTFASLRRDYFHVLDCRSRSIVKVPEDCQYVALSYVWGKASDAPKTPPQSIGHREGKVIEDSIRVTLGLGIQYLWVDRLCIDQTREEEKRKQIRRMDLIYACAALTIIAAAGTGPDHGLPGIDETPRVQQKTFKLGDQGLLSTLPAGKLSIEKSKWNTRGWTFQESVMSRRKLAFTEDQVLFECNAMHCCEVLDIPLDSIHDKHSKMDVNTLSMAALAVKTPVDPTEYYKYVADYSLRDLTYQSDALNAFQGVIYAYRRRKLPVLNLWGIPIYQSDRCMSRLGEKGKNTHSTASRFAISLFWQASPDQKPSAFTRSRENFPSWSWTGWHGAVADKLPHGNVVDKGCFAGVQIWLESLQKKTVESLHNVISSYTSRPLEELYSNRIQIEGWTMKVSVVDVRIGDANKTRLAESSSLGHEPQDGLYVSFQMGNVGTVYSILESRDHSRGDLEGGQYMAFLPLPYTRDVGTYPKRAMLLEKHGESYERIGLFNPRQCLKWDDKGLPQKVWDRIDESKGSALETRKQRFWLA